VLSSLTEGTSISLLEAQACSIPAVVTDVGGNGQVIVDGQTGFLCPLNDIEAMASKFRKLSNLPVFGQTMGASGRNRVINKFSLQKMTNAYEDIYRKILPL
jgi:glycosyltransferase involved in cell wall biosynthesis